MAPSKPLAVYIEQSTKRAFAGAADWPGWCRSGRQPEDALEALIAYGPRYAAVVRRMKPTFPDPSDVKALKVAERLKGDGTTDFGAPSIAPKADTRAVGAADLKQLIAFLRAGWAALDKAAKAAGGAELRKGPRGGGRDLASIVEHVVGAEAGYVHRLAVKAPPTEGAGTDPSVVAALRKIEVAALTTAVEDGLPSAGPRGGKIWLPRYFVRRTVWHALDHAWEIEDRSS